jgi:hypothetical protein
MSFNMAKSEVVYVPLPGKNNCMYPIYIPITFREPEVYRATGRLSLGDYQSTVDNLGGNPALIAVIKALAPLIPSAISGIKNLFNRSDNKPKYRNVNSYGKYSRGPYNKPFGQGPYSQRGYHGLDENNYYKGGYSNRIEGGYPRVAPFNVGGYIPTNPNIKNLKDLQALYDKYD